jgi:hypothetical protein
VLKSALEPDYDFLSGLGAFYILLPYIASLEGAIPPQHRKLVVTSR